jgi:hypothetical protein
MRSQSYFNDLKVEKKGHGEAFPVQYAPRRERGSKYAN